MNIHKITLAIAGATLVFVPPSAHAKSKKSKPVTYVWMTEQCSAVQNPKASLIGGLASLLLGAVVQEGIKSLGDAIKKAGQPKDLHSYGQTNSDLYSASFPGSAIDQANAKQSKFGTIPQLQTLKCIVVVTGPGKGTGVKQPLVMELSDRDRGGVAGKPAPLDAAGKLSTTFQTHLKARDGTELIDQNRQSVFIAKYIESDDRTAFQIVPVYVKLGKALTGRKVDKSRSVAITVSLLPPGGVENGTASVVRTFSFKNITKPREILTPGLQNKTSTWIPYPGITEQVKARLTAATSRRVDADNLLHLLGIPGQLDAQETKKAIADLSRLQPRILNDDQYLYSLSPHTIRADFHETRPGSKFLRKFGETLSNSSEAIAGQITDRIDPSKRSAAAETRLQAEEALRISAVEQSNALEKARADGNLGAEKIAGIKLGAACRQLSNMDFSSLECLSVGQ